jgi:elongation factor 1-beta
MGTVAVTLNIMPTSADADLEKIKEEIQKLDAEIKSIEEKPLAFGLKSLEVLLTLEDTDGGLDKIEDAIKSIEGVENVEAGDISLI